VATDGSDTSSDMGGDSSDSGSHGGDGGITGDGNSDITAAAVAAAAAAAAAATAVAAQILARVWSGQPARCSTPKMSGKSVRHPVLTNALSTRINSDRSKLTDLPAPLLLDLCSLQWSRPT
jgi:hypothetical protein